MKVVLLAFVLGFVVLTPAAHAYSPLLRINEKSLKRLPLAFDIRSERLANGDIQFTVKIAEGAWKIRDGYDTQLGSMHITGYSQKSQTIRHLPTVRKEGTVLCVFMVTEKELEDPDISFYFTTPVPNFGEMNRFYAPLKNFLPGPKTDE
jgi:hypothetical protein